MKIKILLTFSVLFFCACQKVFAQEYNNYPINFQAVITDALDPNNLKYIIIGMILIIIVLTGSILFGNK